jgi:hypothetical protein
MEKKIEVKSLQVVLTNDEIRDKAKDLARAQIDIEEQEKRLKDVQADFKAKIATLEASISILSRAISNGYEYRDIECEWSFDWKKGEKKLSRLDTNEVLRTEKVTQEDRQMKLNAEKEVNTIDV